MVLLPVYLLMVAGLFAISFMANARQALPIVARYEAWSGALPANEIIEIMGRNGTYSVQAAAPVPNPLSVETTLRDIDASHAPMALAILNNDFGNTPNDGPHSEPPYERRAVTATFAYTGLQIFGVPPIQGFTAESATFVAVPHVRKTHESGTQEHFVEDGKFRPRGINRMQIPSENRYQSPTFTHFMDEGGQNTDPGIWSIDARIGGQESTERGMTQNWLSNRP